MINTPLDVQVNDVIQKADRTIILKTDIRQAASIASVQIMALLLQAIEENPSLFRGMGLTIENVIFDCMVNGVTFR